MRYIGVSFFLISWGCGETNHPNRKVISFKAKSVEMENGGDEIYSDKVSKRDASYGKVHQIFDFYEPDVDTPAVRPLIVLVHQGAFLTGDKNDLIITQLARDFCRRGFKVASVNYRLIGNQFADLTALLAKSYTRSRIVEATADVREAILYFRTHQSELGIDVNNIFCVGYSAGAIIANQLIFSDKQEFVRYIAAKNNILTGIGSNPILEQQNALDVAPARLVKGAIALSGCVMDNAHLSYQDLNDVHLMLVHGTKDMVVPASVGKPFEKIVKDKLLLNPVGIAFQLGIVQNGQTKTTQTTLHKGISLDKSLFRTLRNALSSDMYGSKHIFKSLRKNKHLKYVEITNGAHNFMTNEQGEFNQTYKDVRKEMMDFLLKTMNKNKL